YVIKGHYTPTMLYDPCISEEQYFRINEPTQLSIMVNNQNITRGKTLTLRGVLHSSDTKEPLIDKPITLKINGLNVQTNTTNDEGEYIFTLSTKNISSHSISIQTIYTSPDIKWRNAASPLVKISFYADYVQYFNSLAWLLLIFIFASVILSAFYLNKRRRTLANKTRSTSLSSPKQSPDTSILETIPSFLQEKTFSDEKGLAQGNPISLKDKIIATYHTFLGYLSQRGIPIKKTDSHRDIQQRLYSTKLPKDTVDMVTIGFEIARYSPYPVLQEDADAFDQQVFSMITSFKEDVKEQ
ncbi:MAG: hypothetical protein QCH96_06835, partial [Candidatus Thermoplasmatota archaeon]|nr:hypothetical protein [Candidatus Thermoplasmatota archaeon]